MLDAFVSAGGRSIDTADVYSAWVAGNSGGDSERIIGEWLTARGRRYDVVIATKVAALEARSGLSAANIRAAVHESLARLKTDYIDLYYAHSDDLDTAQDEYVAAFSALVTEGKVREVGASNFTPERLRSALEIASATAATPFTVSQDRYNLVERGLEFALAPTLIELGIVELPYSSLGSGFLTGKYRPGATVDSARAGGAGKYLDTPANVTLLETLDDIAAAHAVSVSAVSLAWVRQQRGVAAPIASARTVEQLGSLVESFTLTLTDDDLARLA